MQDYTLYRVKLSLPRGLRECSRRGLVTCFPADADPGRSEIDIFGVILIFETRGQQSDNMHLRHASITGKIAYRFAPARIVRNIPNQLADDVA